MVTLKSMNLLLQLYTPSKCQIYNNWTVHEHKCLSSFLFFRFSSNWEREWYIKLGIKRNSPKVTYLIFRRGSTGESFFFYGLIDFGFLLYFDLRPSPKILFQGDTPEGSDTFQLPVIERDRVGGLRLMIWDKVKVPLCHYSDAPEESNLWTAWQLFPLDDD